jgi:hypothetical protein
MTAFDSAQGSQRAYDFWLGLIPQFLGQFGGAVPGPGVGTAADPKANPAAGGAFAPLAGLMFPADQIGRSAVMTQQWLQALAQSIAAMLQSGGATNLVGQWAAAMPGLAAGPASALQAMTQPWADLAGQLAGTTPAQLNTVFDRTYGALSDALGMGPMRKLHAAWQDLVAAGIAQQEVRGRYALLVQGAFAQGFQRLLVDLAGKADAGERVDSVLALLRLWALRTEDAVHETLQSDAGLAATTALTRSGLAYRRRLQQVAAIVAQMLDMATRHDLDEAYREIQALKRELRASRAAPAKRDGSGAGKRRVPRKR